MKDRETKNRINREYYWRNRKRILEKSKEYNMEVRSSRCKELNERNRRWRQANFERHLYQSAKAGAKKRGLDFLIDVEDIVIPETCPYLGVTLTRLQGKGRLPNNASIDRIDNTLGYVKGNIQIISTRANMLKRDMSLAELKTFAKNILNIHQEIGELIK